MANNLIICYSREGGESAVNIGVGRTVASGAVDDNLNHSFSFSVPPAGVSRLT